MQQQTTTIDVYQIVTDRIIELLEAGTVPWIKPWSEAGIPENLLSHRPYRGINVFLLSSLDYEKNLFLTWQQIQEIGGKVSKGEKGWIFHPKVYHLFHSIVYQRFTPKFTTRSYG